MSPYVDIVYWVIAEELKETNTFSEVQPVGNLWVRGSEANGEVP